VLSVLSSLLDKLVAVTFDPSAETDTFVEPSSDLDAYHCPYSDCATYTQQRQLAVGVNLAYAGPTLAARRCERCRRATIWAGQTEDDELLLVYPPRLSGRPAHHDMPPEVRNVYEEAQSVAGLSPRSAAGLLRLALQMLVDDLVPGTDRLDTKIGKLVGQGLDPRIQRAMDILRVIGNNAVHPGQIDLNEDSGIVHSMFGLLNLVVEQMISRPKHIDDLFGTLPEGARQGIERRNARAIEAP
jgi:hypothetical protein